MHAIPRTNVSMSPQAQPGRGVLPNDTIALILEQDARGTIIRASSASWQLFGCAERRLEGLRLTDLVAAKAHPAILDAMGRALTGTTGTLTVDLRRGAAYPHAAVTITALRGGGFRTQMTPLVRPAANDEAPVEHPAKRLEADQLANVSHEIRTPLNAVIGFADALRQESFGPLGDRRYRDYAQLIQESGQHVLALVNDLLDLSKAEADKVTIDARPVAVDRLIESCCSMIRLEAERAGLALHVRTAPTVGTLMVDEKVLRQIVLNLLSNALKFTDRGSITVRTRVLDGHLVISVEDTGIGMSADDLKRVGERYYQARKEGVRGARGSGLGLALSQALAKAHGGRLDIASKPAAGTLATLSLPVEETKREHREKRRYQATEARGIGKVLDMPGRLGRTG